MAQLIRASSTRTRAVALYLGWLSLAACGACSRKTPVPFKRTPTDAAVSQDAAPLAAADARAEAVTGYPEGTQQVVVAGTNIARASGQIYATIERDLDGDGQVDVVLAGSDDAGRAVLEVLEHGATKPRSQLALNPEPLGRGCRATGVQLALLGAQLGLASVDFQCEAGEISLDGPTAAQANAAPAAEAPAQQPLDLPPPEPSAVITQTHHFVFTLDAAPRVLLRLCADWNTESQGVDSELLVTGNDVDGDQLEDVRVELQPRAASENADEPKPLQLTWLNRTTGLARDRLEPEASLQASATEAQRLLARSPKDAVARASDALRMYRLLCKEGGAARLWVDDARGIGCGASAAAGKALATLAIGQAKQQRLLPALEARTELDAPVYTVDKKLREQVSAAIGTIRGDTSYQWRMGPALRPASAPALHLPTLGFIDENTLLLRGPIAQSFDLLSRVSTPTGVPGSVLATDAGKHFVLTDIVRDCDGYRVRIAPANRVIGGIVTGAFSSEPLLQPAPGSDANNCTRSSRPHSDHGGFVLLGLNVAGAVFAHGKHVWLLPLDAQGNATALARELPANAPLPPLLSPGALDASARYMALATSEGVALIDRLQDSARLIRTPESCAGGRVSDAALSPSGQKLAMLCAGRIYVAEPAAESSQQLRPMPEHP